MVGVGPAEGSRPESDPTHIEAYCGLEWLLIGLDLSMYVHSPFFFGPQYMCSLN